MKIKLENINLSFYNKTVLNNISLEIDEGKKVALLGYSGSGKETLLKLLSGILEQDSGKYYLDNYEINSKHNSTVRKKMSYVFQSGGLISNLNVKENLLLPLNFHLPEISIKDKLRKIHLLLEKFLITHTLEQRPSDLTVEEYKLINYIRAVITSPEILLLHEPLSLCDIPIAKKITEDIINNSDKNRIIIFVSQSNQLLLKLADEFIIMDKGNILLKGNLIEVKNSEHPTVKNIYEDFLGEIFNET